jgi:nitrite reductase/ring-hydroxylating ferredoxin subunit
VGKSPIGGSHVRNGMNSGEPPFFLFPAADLAERTHRKLRVIFEGRHEECLVLRFNGLPYAYINRCVHMPRPLDCQQDVIFDRSGKRLRCSMHGIVFRPETGESVSVLCEGEKLRSVSVFDADGMIGIDDYRISAWQRVG